MEIMFAELLEKALDEMFTNIQERRLYHVSKRNRGPEITFIPRIPLEAMSGEDEKIKRVCLSKTIEGALIALGNQFPYDDFICYVYELSNNPKIYKPSKTEVPDVEETGELWALEPAKLKRLYKVMVKGRKRGKLSIEPKYEIINGR